jgi:hypothetical protein
MIVADVFLIGAGFSKAVSTTMPLTSDLAIEIDSLRSESRSPEWLWRDFRPDSSTGQVEQWLTAIAEPHSYRTDREIAEAALLWIQVTERIVRAISEATHMSVAHPDALAPWFIDLLTRWHNDHTTVITFNYDTLIEIGYSQVDIGDGQRGYYQQIWPRVARTVERPTWGSTGGARKDTLRLLKLHGSIHWQWDATSRSAESIVDVDLPANWGQREINDWWLDSLDGTLGSTCVVPPIAAKTVFYESSAIARLWRRGRRALDEADRLIRDLLSDTAGLSEMSVVVVDQALGTERTELLKRVSTATGSEPLQFESVAEFWAWYQREPSRRGRM